MITLAKTSLNSFVIIFPWFLTSQIVLRDLNNGFSSSVVTGMSIYILKFDPFLN